MLRSLYFARHGALLVWRVTEFTHAPLYTTNPAATVAAVYREFRRVAAQAMTDEGTDPPPAPCEQGRYDGRRRYQRVLAWV
jgi:hypothetical protein